ncbi:MAG: hypothetical protein KAY37_02530 [Phycisphaerae bacterium]|nr:hypothetical protein [Phycisphaerae bacterium]
MAGMSLAPIILIVLAVLVILLLVLPGRGHWLRITLLVLLIMAGAGVFVAAWTYRCAGRERSVAFTRAQARSEQAREQAAQARLELGDGTFTITAEVPEIPEIDRQLLADIRLPARFENRKLIVGGFATQEYGADTPPPPDPVEGNRRRANEKALQAAVRHELAEELADYLDNLLTQGAPVESGLAQVRASLRQLTLEQRRLLVGHLVREHIAIGRNQLIETSNPETGAALNYFAREISIDPDEVEQLVLSTVSPARHESRVSTTTAILGTVGVLIVAAVVLKVTTRRHVRRRAA